MTVCESALRDYKFELPSSTVRQIEIDRVNIESPSSSLKKILDEAPGFQLAQFEPAITQFTNEFLENHGMKVELTDEAKEELSRIAGFDPTRIVETARGLLKGYEHGLKLVQQNCGASEFLLEKEDILEPQETLEKMIRESYRKG